MDLLRRLKQWWFCWSWFSFFLFCLSWKVCEVTPDLTADPRTSSHNDHWPPTSVCVHNVTDITYYESLGKQHLCFCHSQYSSVFVTHTNDLWLYHTGYFFNTSSQKCSNFHLMKSDIHKLTDSTYYNWFYSLVFGWLKCEALTDVILSVLHFKKRKNIHFSA